MSNHNHKDVSEVWNEELTRRDEALKATAGKYADVMVRYSNAVQQWTKKQQEADTAAKALRAVVESEEYKVADSDPSVRDAQASKSSLAAAIRRSGALYKAMQKLQLTSLLADSPMIVVRTTIRTFAGIAGVGAELATALPKSEITKKVAHLTEKTFEPIYSDLLTLHKVVQDAQSQK